MSTFEELVVAGSRELRAAGLSEQFIADRERVRREALANMPPIDVLVARRVAARQKANQLGLAARAAMWGSPSGSSFMRGTAGRATPRARNTRFT